MIVWKATMTAKNIPRLAISNSDWRLPCCILGPVGIGGNFGRLHWKAGLTPELAVALCIRATVEVLKVGSKLTICVYQV